MPTSSTIQLSCQFNRRPNTSSKFTSFVEEKPGQNTPETNSNLNNNMRPQETPKKVSNGFSVKKEKGVTYKECRKNHAANIGGYAVDGCREFMAAGEEGTSAALKCAACSCHRSFHKREVENEGLCDCSSNSTTRK